MNEQDLIAAIEQALVPSVNYTDSDMEGLSIAELADRLDVHPRRLRVVLTRLKEAGRLRVGRGYRESLDGRFLPVPVYNLDVPEVELKEQLEKTR